MSLGGRVILYGVFLFPFGTLLRPGRPVGARFHLHNEPNFMRKRHNHNGCLANERRARAGSIGQGGFRRVGRAGRRQAIATRLHAAQLLVPTPSPGIPLKLTVSRERGRWAGHFVILSGG